MQTPLANTDTRANIENAATFLVFVSSPSCKETQIAEVHQTGADVVSTITSFSCSNSWDDPCWTSTRNNLELIELSSLLFYCANTGLIRPLLDKENKFGTRVGIHSSFIYLNPLVAACVNRINAVQ
jgi:hypothetical protein